jgi:hypothetical protein
MQCANTDNRNDARTSAIQKYVHECVHWRANTIKDEGDWCGQWQSKLGATLHVHWSSVA